MKPSKKNREALRSWEYRKKPKYIMMKSIRRILN
jgi:hypothetical protein